MFSRNCEVLVAFLVYYFQFDDVTTSKPVEEKKAKQGTLKLTKFSKIATIGLCSKVQGVQKTMHAVLGCYCSMKG